MPVPHEPCRARRAAAGGRLALLGCVLFAALGGCRQAPPRPSIVLAVLDTMRADAVSAYGAVDGTTPTLDRLAREGLRYTNAYANANWTLPSHATLFTGLLPSQHRVQDGFAKLEADVPTVAELLSRAGYETLGINENPWLTAKQGVTRGFEQFQAAGDMAAMVKQWRAKRSADRPFFLFVNIMDAHWPYRVRDSNPYLPAGVSIEQARLAARDLESYRCNCAADDPSMQILRGLYLGNVRAADAKLGAVLAALAPVETPLIVVVLSDHGEHLGEHGLVEHDVGIDRFVTHVPLVVHGLANVSPAVIQAPVQLADLMPTILGWAGVAVPPGLPGQPLPTAEPAPSGRAIVAEYHDYRDERFYAQFNDPVRELLRKRWEHCTAADRADGDMRAVIRPPYELMWYEKYRVQLFDVQTDPSEARDLAAAMPERVAELDAHLQRVLAAANPRAAPRAELDPAQVERLRALGYLGGTGHEHEADAAPEQAR